VATYALFALYAVVACVLIALMFKQLWNWQNDRTIQGKWQERERQLSRRRPRTQGHEVLEPRAWPAAEQHSNSPRYLHTGQAEVFARVLFVVARDQRELVEFLHKDFAAEEAEGVIEILMDRRHDPKWPDGRPPEADGRRDPRRNRMISTDLREMGCALVRQPTPLPRTTLARKHFLDPVALLAGDSRGDTRTPVDPQGNYRAMARSSPNAGP
jgi:hypothetical protein